MEALIDPGTTPCSIQKVMEGPRLALCNFDSWSANHTRRSGNTAAHLMARYAKVVSHNVVWVEDIPPMIEYQILSNVHALDLGAV